MEIMSQIVQVENYVGCRVWKKNFSYLHDPKYAWKEVNLRHHAANDDEIPYLCTSENL